MTTRNEYGSVYFFNAERRFTHAGQKSSLFGEFMYFAVDSHFHFGSEIVRVVGVAAVKADYFIVVMYMLFEYGILSRVRQIPRRVHLKRASTTLNPSKVFSLANFHTSFEFGRSYLRALGDFGLHIYLS